MKDAGKQYDVVIYPGAGHGFMRAGEEPKAKPGNKRPATSRGSAENRSWASSEASTALVERSPIFASPKCPVRALYNF